MKEEIWKRFEDTRYMVSKTGLVKNGDTGRVLSQMTDRSGYKYLNIYDPYKITMRTHKMVAATHVENPLCKPVVNHKDGIKSNIDSDNLEWVTHSENTQHAYDTGLKKRGEDFCCAKLTNADAEAIKLLFVAGVRSVDIAADYGVSDGTISNMRSGRSWKQIRPDLVWAMPDRIKSTKKLTAADIPIIREMIAENESDTFIANHFGVNRGTIFQVRCGKNWKNY